MATFDKFEEINASEKARELTKAIYTVTNQGQFNKDISLREQIRRASVSVMANIAEGFDRGGKKEFIQFLSIAKGSLGEVKSHLYVALDMTYIDQTTFDALYKLSDNINCMVFRLMSYLQKTDIKGLKYK